MKGIKTILWICAVSCLLSFGAALMPWKVITTILQWFEAQPFSSEPMGLYTFRVFMIMSGMIGIFFLILAQNPLKYNGMFNLGSYGLLCFGVMCLIFGIFYNLRFWIYLSDAIFCMLAGALLLILKKRAT
jgi:hypothetical protein